MEILEVEFAEPELLVLTERQRNNFEAKIDRSSNPKGCWVWIARLNHDGYGTFKFRDRSELSHRMSHRIHKGPIPDDTTRVLHSCDNPACCNPAHLRLGSQKENAADRESRGRGNHAVGDATGARRHPEKRPRGSKHGKSKLDEIQVMEIKALLSSGRTPRKICSAYGVSHYAIDDIRRGKNWRHIA